MPIIIAAPTETADRLEGARVGGWKQKKVSKKKKRQSAAEEIQGELSMV
jgi:hypothetical protein